MDSQTGSKVEMTLLVRAASHCEIKFLYDLEEDSPHSVASEMIQELGLDPSCIMRASQIIFSRVEELLSDSNSSDDEILPESL